MKKILVPLIFLAMLAVPTAVFAHSQATVSATEFYACENSTTGEIDYQSITQDSEMKCPTAGTFTALVKWNVKGIDGKDGKDGTNGTNGTNGINGTNGKDGAPGIPFTHAPCTEVLSGSQQQENKVFCISGIEPDGGAIYNVAIAAAGSHIILGTPIYDTPSQDWGNVPLTNYVGFTSGFHMEVHSDGKVRVYNTLNQQVF